MTTVRVLLLLSCGIILMNKVGLSTAADQCSSNSDCPSGRVCCAGLTGTSPRVRSCQFGSCLTRFCSSDGDCGGPDECCSFNICGTFFCKECHSNSDCSPSEYCCKHRFINDRNVCRRSCVRETCHSNSDCGGPGEYCDSNHVCAKSTTVAKCSTDGDCRGEGTCCKSNHCVTVGCSECNSNSDCKVPGEHCFSNGKCQKSSTTTITKCSSDGDCRGDGACCKNNECVTVGCSECNSNSDCKVPGEHCSLNGKCQKSSTTTIAKCSSDGDCRGEGECCKSNQCATVGCQQCFSNSQCASSEYCCRRRKITDPKSCRRSCVGESCQTDTDCGGPGERCDSKHKCTKSSSTFPAWAIGLIAAFSTLFSAIVICACSYRRCHKKRTRGVIVGQPTGKTNQSIALEQSTTSTSVTSPASAASPPPPPSFAQPSIIYPSLSTVPSAPPHPSQTYITQTPIPAPHPSAPPKIPNSTLSSLINHTQDFQPLQCEDSSLTQLEVCTPSQSFECLGTDFASCIDFST